MKYLEIVGYGIEILILLASVRVTNWQESLTWKGEFIWRKVINKHLRYILEEEYETCYERDENAFLLANGCVQLGV